MMEKPEQAVGSTLASLAMESGATTAVRFKSRSLSFSEVVAELDRLRGALGGTAPTRALLLLPDGICAYLAHLYMFLHQVAAVPVSPLAPVHQLSNVTTLVRPDLVITSPALLRKYSISDFPCPVLLASEPRDTEADIGWEMRDGSREHSPSAPNDVRVILFTSGSTGTPKGVCLGERSLTSAARMNLSILSLDSNRRSVSTVPLFDYYGLIQIYSHLLAGAEFVLGESVAFPVSVLDRVEDVGATDLVGVPYGLRRLAAGAGEVKSSALARLDFITSSSETLGRDVQEMLFRVAPSTTIVDVYGLTEAGRACSRVLREPSHGSGFIGRPSPGVVISGGSAEDPDELVIRGPNVMLGYMSGVTDAGEAAYAPCDEVRTGDEGYVDATGNVHILGRREHILNVRGEKIHPVEIESIATALPSIDDARVRLEEGPEPELVLEVVTAEPEPDFSALLRCLRERLPLQFVPRRIVAVEEIERTQIGLKTIRR